MTYYRYEADYQGRPIIRVFDIDRSTKCGHWLKERLFNGDYLYTSTSYAYYDKQRWINKEGCLRQFAYKTKKDALENYYHRRLRYIEILKNRLEIAKNSLPLILPAALDINKEYAVMVAKREKELTQLISLDPKKEESLVW